MSLLTRLVLVVTLALATAAGVACLWPHGITVGTFNIERYPRDTEQIAGAFETIDTLGVQALAVQEIRDPEGFAAEAQSRLGRRWAFVYTDGTGSQYRNGLLYDARALELVESRTLSELRVQQGTMPGLLARFETRRGDEITFVVVHFKSLTEGREIRARQYDALRRLLGDLLDGDGEIVVLGDFNATEDADREDLDLTAGTLALSWATEELSCTAYWRRQDGCFGSRLDHILTTARPRGTVSRGPCETDGCDPGDQCPIFHRQVSDHCPVVTRIRL